MNQFNQSGFHGFDDGEFKNAVKNFKMTRRKKWVFIILAIALVLALSAGTLFSELMEYLQIKEIGSQFTGVYWTNLYAKIGTQVVGFFIIFAAFFVHALVIKKLAVEPNFNAPFLKKKWPYLLASLVLSAFLARLAGGTLYQKLLFFLNAEEFSIKDPLFNQNIGYYIFSRPFLMSITGGLKSLFIFFIAISLVTYFLIFVKNGHRSLKDVIREETGATIHILILLLGYFILAIFSYKFSAENLMFSSFGSQNGIFGAGYIEANIWRLYYKAAPFLVLLAFLFAFYFLFRKKHISALISVAVIPVVFILVMVLASVMDAVVVNPNERNLQAPYIAYNMEATREAYNLSSISEKEFDPQYNVTADDVENNDEWLAGTRIADYGATQAAYNQLQFLRKYYTFHDVDVAPYEIDGKLNVVFLAAREMNTANIDGSAKSYANLTFRYTHGFGAVVSPVNRVTQEGQPEFLVKDIPPVSRDGMPEITQPRIYYGELTNDYVIVGGGNRELDYSEGLEDVEYTFDGNTGIRLTPMKRLLFSLYYKDYKMLVSGNINSESKILINRNVVERVRRVLPFLSTDSDPYLVISDDGKLYFVVNHYTTSSNFPYAQPYNGVNYVRNSITSFVDAYTGDVKVYLTDENDPIARAYRNMYPSVFSEGEIPEELKHHIRVPEEMFKMQAQMYQTYHVKDAGQFYDQADVWEIAQEKYDEDQVTMEPYYNIMNLDGQDEMVIMLPFVVQGKHNMVGLLLQRNSAEHYGEMVLYRFPKNETVYGPMQIENKIDNDPDISREMTLWGQGGSNVIRGNLLVVPFKNSLLYVEPIYITSKNNASLPELKRIVVGYGDSIAMETSLKEALISVFKEAHGMPAQEVPEPDVPSGEITEGEVEDLETLIGEMLDSYDRFKSSAQSNNWSAMGEHLDELDETIEALREKRN